MRSTERIIIRLSRETRFRGDRGLVVLQSGFSAAAREAEDARGWSKLRRLKWHVIDGD
jgi:hypothetical protein